VGGSPSIQAANTRVCCLCRALSAQQRCPSAKSPLFYCHGRREQAVRGRVHSPLSLAQPLMVEAYLGRPRSYPPSAGYCNTGLGSCAMGDVHQGVTHSERPQCNMLRPHRPTLQDRSHASHRHSDQQYTRDRLGARKV
jgi:hypothetical protein